MCLPKEESTKLEQNTAFGFGAVSVEVFVPPIKMASPFFSLSK